MSSLEEEVFKDLQRRVNAFSAAIWEQRNIFAQAQREILADIDARMTLGGSDDFLTRMAEIRAHLVFFKFEDTT